MTKQDTDIAILGGGVVGLACAYYLLKAGRSVRIIEQGAIGKGSSHGNCGTLTPSHAPPLAMPGMIRKAIGWMLTPDAPFYVKPSLDPALWSWLLQVARRCTWDEFKRHTPIKGALLMRSRELIERLVREDGLDCEFEASGTLYVYRDAKNFEDSQWLPRALAEIGMTCETIDGAAAQKMEPALKEGVAGAHLNRQDAHLRPDRYVAELARRVLELGGVIDEQRRVTGVRANGDRVEAVRTEAGDVAAREVVIALGSWSPELGRRIGLSIPVQPGKGYSITFDRPALAPKMPLVLKERSVCVTTWSSGYRLGSTMEFAGYDSSLNRRRLDALTRGAAEYLRDPVGPHRLEEWYGWRPMTYDDLPIIGRAPRWKNLSLATGHGMLGVTLSAVTGELMSQILTDRETALDAAPFSPARFNG